MSSDERSEHGVDSRRSTETRAAKVWHPRSGNSDLEGSVHVAFELQQETPGDNGEGGGGEMGM